ncbi:MAG: hypothetical protein E6G94_08720 [Alphaproteobacteria bacterium]|nr:MAG: hypothetical protein E6G94_08720 [Alphaproteobacteria bacterium]
MSELMTIVAPADAEAGAAAPAEPAGLLLHKFVKNDSWRGALTPDATGENLPRAGSAWIYANPVLVSPSDRRVGATSIQIAAGVSERGYFLFPISDDA